MDCPFCGAELEDGVLQSSYSIYWLEKPAKYLPPKTAKGGECLSGADNLMQSPYISASRCPTCRKIIFDY